MLDLVEAAKPREHPAPQPFSMDIADDAIAIDVDEDPYERDARLIRGNAMVER